MVQRLMADPQLILVTVTQRTAVDVRRRAISLGLDPSDAAFRIICYRDLGKEQPFGYRYAFDNADILLHHLLGVPIDSISVTGTAIEGASHG